MMPPTSIRISYWLQTTSDTDPANPWIITWWLEPRTDYSDADLTTDLSSASQGFLWYPWWGAGAAGGGSGSGLRSALPSGCRVYYAEVAARLGVDGGGPATVTWEGAPATGIASSGVNGTRSGTLAPTPLAMVVRKHVAGTSRQRGRNFIPLNTADVASNGVVTPPAAVQTGFETAINLVAPWDDFTSIVAAADGTARRPITSISISTIVGVQKRRRV